MAGSGHDLEWEERLQDWIDGDLDSDESDAVLAHVARCANCHERMDALRMLDDELARCLPRPALEDDFNRSVLAAVGSISRDLASARARLENDWRGQESTLLRARRRIRNWIILDVLAILLLIAVAMTCWPLPDISAWVDRLFALNPNPGWSLPLSIAAVSTVAAFAILGLLAAAEHDFGADIAPRRKG